MPRLSQKKALQAVAHFHILFLGILSFRPPFSKNISCMNYLQRNKYVEFIEFIEIRGNGIEKWDSFSGRKYKTGKVFAAGEYEPLKP